MGDDQDAEALGPGPREDLDSTRPAANLEHAAPAQPFDPEEDVGKTPSLPTGESDDDRLDSDGETAPRSTALQSMSPAVTSKARVATREKGDDMHIIRMHKFTLHETTTRYYLVGADNLDQHYRVLKIDRTASPGQLSIFEDDIVYNRRERDQLLNAIDDGNKPTGGLKFRCSAWGLLGFIRFTDAYYMLLITKRAQVAMIGGHYIYQVDGTELIPLTTGPQSRFATDRSADEARFLGIMNTLDLTRFFYFSYSYNITRSLQQNIIRERQALQDGRARSAFDFQDMFVWNSFLLEPAKTALKNVYDWCFPIVHGSIDQSSLDVYGRRIFITLLARRSRFFAGARFLKRGANDRGYVANDVETEQIVSEALTTSFHAPGPRLFASPSYTSYVQHRGSIPLYWTQDNTGVNPKPDIDLSLPDPFFSTAALHFDNLFERYGQPIYVLNLIKQRERLPRETKLLHEYQRAIDFLNQSLPKDKRILYETFDMARAAKSRGQDVISTLEVLAEKVLHKTGFFHNGDDDFDGAQVQNGVARTNCIDCLDRTNAAQFVIGKRALGHQLQALGIITGTMVDYDTDCVDNFTHMYHSHGDAIAMQYGGSHLVNTMATYRKINQWQSSSRDMVESFKRYYHNSFLDSQRQEAYNLFLGHYRYSPGQAMLWDLTTDVHLHHRDPRTWLSQNRRDYIQWYTPAYLELRRLPASLSPDEETLKLGSEDVEPHDDYWREYYRPLALTSFLKLYIFRLNCPPKEAKDSSYPSRHQDASPFVIRRKQQDHGTPRLDKKPPRKGVTILDPSNEKESRESSIAARRRGELHVETAEGGSSFRHSILRDSQPLAAPSGHSASLQSSSTTGRTSFRPADKALVHQWTLAQFHDNSLNPNVTTAEEDEYTRYIEHPLNLPLVVSNEMPDAGDPSALEFYEYLDVFGGSVQPPPQDMDAASLAHSVPDSPRDRAETDSIRSYTRPPSSAGWPLTPFSHALASIHQQSVAHHHHHHHQTPQLHAHRSTQFRAPSFVEAHAPAYPQHEDSGRFRTADDDVEEFESFLQVKDNPLDVEDEDGERKRYKAYRQWLKGKSFFKQSKVDPEWQTQLPVR